MVGVLPAVTLFSYLLESMELVGMVFIGWQFSSCHAVFLLPGTNLCCEEFLLVNDHTAVTLFSYSLESIELVGRVSIGLQFSCCHAVF